jgi:hypothetical protein
MAMHRDLSFKGALRSNVDGNNFISLKVKLFKDPTNTTEDKMEWRRVFYLIKATLSARMVLRLDDGNKPTMNKLFYFVPRKTEAIELSVEYLNDLDVFPGNMPHNRPFDILLEDEFYEVLEHESEKSDGDDEDTDDDDSEQF